MARELLPSVIDANFKKDIALINGLALLGSSIGGLLLPPLFDVTFDMYGLSGTFLVMSGVLLHSVPAGMLLWPPKTAENKTDSQKSKKHNEVGGLAKSCSKQVKIGANDASDTIAMHSIPALTLPNTESEIFSNGVCVETVFKDMSSKTLNNIFIDKDGDPKSNRENKESFIKSSKNRAHIAPEPPETSSEKETTRKRNQEIIRLFHNLPATKENTLQTEKDGKRIIPTKSASTCIKKKNNNKLLETISLFWDPLFILVTTSQSLFKTVYITFVLIFMDFARDVEIPRSQAIYLVMCISASDIVGRVGLGWITDRGYIWASKTSLPSLLP